MKILSIVTMDPASIQAPGAQEMERMGALIDEMKREVRSSRYRRRRAGFARNENRA